MWPGTEHGELKMTQAVELLFQETGNPGKVKRKGNNTKSLKTKSKRKAKEKAAAVASGSTEVMVKISGYGKGGAHVKAHLMYITRHAMADQEKIAIENEMGQLFDTVDDVKQLFEDWSADIDANKSPKQSKNQRDTMHMVLSMPGKADPLVLRDAVRAFAGENFGANHEYVFALHTDTNNDHCHLAVKCRGFNGRQLHTPAGQIQRWRESFAEELRVRGIEAEATPRAVRGVVRRPEKQVLRHIDDPAPQNRQPRQSRVKTAKLEEAVSALRAEAQGTQPAQKPWEAATRSAQAKTKTQWLRAAQELKTRSYGLKTKDGKELSNEPINYAHIDARNVRASQLRGAAVAGIERDRRPGPITRATDLYKPGHRAAGARREALSNAGMRDMPDGNVVRDQGGTAVFLRANSRHRLDTGRPADFEVRRQGIGAAANAAGQRGREQLTLAEKDKRLAVQMERFAALMPEPVTAQELLVRQLRAEAAAKQNAISAERKQSINREMAPSQVKDHGQDTSQDKGAGKDTGRSR